MSSKVLLIGIVLVILIALSGAVYFYYPLMPQAPAQTARQTVPTTPPDNTIAAGSVTAIASTKITIRKQDGSSASFTISQATVIKSAAAAGQPSPAKLSAVRTGAIVLITPDAADATTAGTILMIPMPPTSTQ